MAIGTLNSRVAASFVTHDGDVGASPAQSAPRVRAESTTTDPGATSAGRSGTSSADNQQQRDEPQGGGRLVVDDGNDLNLEGTDSDDGTLENTTEDTASDANSLREASLSDETHADADVAGGRTVDEDNDTVDNETIELPSYDDAMLQVDADGRLQLNYNNLQVITRLHDPETVSHRLVRHGDDTADSSLRACGRSKPGSLPDEITDYAKTQGPAVSLPTSALVFGMRE